VPIGSQGVNPLQAPTVSDPSRLGAGQGQDAQTTPTPSVAPITATQVLMTVLSPNGTPIDVQADRVVSWRGEIPVTGEYTIELRPIAGLAGASFPYKLSVTQIAAPPPGRSSTDPYGTPPVIVPVPRGENANPVFDPDNSQPESSNNTMPSPVPIEIPSTRPSRQTIPQSGTDENVPTRRRSATFRRNRIEPESQRPRRQFSNADTPSPRRRRQRPENTETPTNPAPAVTPAEDNIETNASPQPEPALAPPTSDNQAPQPNTTDGGNSNPPSTEPNPAPSPATNNLTDP
jgi:hypothetical protein